MTWWTGRPTGIGRSCRQLKAKEQPSLSELRQLSNSHPESAPVQEKLGMGLFNVIYDAAKAGDQKQSLAIAIPTLLFKTTSSI
jgi:hypothetical protein